MFYVFAHIFLMIYHKNSIIFYYYLISNGDDGSVVTVFKSSLMSITLSGDSYSIRVSTPAGATALRCGISLDSEIIFSVGWLLVSGSEVEGGEWNAPAVVTAGAESTFFICLSKCDRINSRRNWKKAKSQPQIRIINGTKSCFSLMGEIVDSDCPPL